MSDWPQSETFHKSILSSWSFESVGQPCQTFNPAAPASTAWGTANLAMYMPLKLAANVLVIQVWWHNGATVSGNVDAGVYTSDGTRLFSSGSTAQATTSSTQSVTLGTSVLLTPGSYYLALAASSATATFVSLTVGIQTKRLMGIVQQAAALPLPASATFAASAVSPVPLFGISSKTVI